MNKNRKIEIAAGIVLLVAAVLGGLTWFGNRDKTIVFSTESGLSGEEKEVLASEPISRSGHILVPSLKTIPEGFIGILRQVNNSTAGYAGQYDSREDMNSNGNPAQIIIASLTDPAGTNYERKLEYYKELSLEKKTEVKEFDYNALHGLVFNSTIYPGNIDHILIVKDELYFYSISTRDGTKNKFSADSLIAIFKTFESKPIPSFATGNVEPLSDVEQKISPASLNELASTEPTVGSQVVIGYIWHSEKGSPNFSSVILPIWGFNQDKEFMQREYTIDIWDGKNFIYYTKTSPLKEIIFPAEGVYKFRVLGINPDYAICPGQIGYIWGMKFITSGRFDGTREPILMDVSSQGKICRAEL